MVDETACLLHIFMQTFAFAFLFLKAKDGTKKNAEPKRKMTLDAANVQQTTLPLVSSDFFPLTLPHAHLYLCVV